MNRKIFLICATLALTLTLNGCQLAKPGVVAPQSDQFIGFYITFDNTVDERQVYASKQAHINKENKDPYGEPYEYYRYDFRGVYDGVPFFFEDYSPPGGFFGNCADAGGAISNRQLSVGVGGGVTIAGTLYMAFNSALSCILNPVYLRSDGSVYAKISDEGAHSIYHDTFVQGTGYIHKESHSKYGTISLILSFKIKNPAESIRVLQMNADDTPITSEDYLADDLPESVAIDAKTEYVIVETQSLSPDGSQTSWEIFERGDESFSIYPAREDGVCVEKQVSLLWSYDY